ncbi:MAG TPA: CbiQ family ECF transporter T component [Anaeromyxobacter sp.]
MSPVRAVDPRIALGVAVAAWCVALASRHAAGPLAVAALAVAVVAALRRVRALRALAPTLVAGVIAAALQALLGASPDRLGAAALLVARVAACGAVGAALAAAAPLSDLLAALAWAHVPAPLLELVALTERQRHALAESAWRIRDAQRLRLGWIGLRRSVRSMGALAGAAACRALAQADVTADALALRGAAGPLAPASLSAPTRRDAAVAVTAALGLAACALLAGGLAP